MHRNKLIGGGKTANGKDAVDFVAIEGETELTPPEMYAANLIEWAVDRRASDLFVSDNENSVMVSIRRFGKVEQIRCLARSYGRKLQGHLRVLAGSDAGEIIRPTEGRGVLTTQSGRTVDLRLSTMPTLFGQDVAVRLFDPVNGSRSIESLGYEPDELTAIKDLISQPSGLILVAGPVASGKSSTLYAAVEALNDGTRKIHTLEDPIEHALAGVMQTQVNLRAGLDFADLLSSVLRHSPDVIMVGEIRDARTAATAVRAGASGQLVLATIHAKTAAEAVDSMLQYETNPKFLASALIGVINQRLVRRLCRLCAQPVKADGLNEVSKRVNELLGDQPPRMYLADGCEACFGDGYDSMTCVPEIMLFDRALCEQVANGCSAGDLEKLACERGMVHMSEVMAARVLRGITSPIEANRMFSDPMLADLALRAK
ncbi:Type II secretion system protein E [Rubripirellula amarantea]|uniref:Type II secretion system protein E n=1 Tax=Rubripirellula amarantea TaxID=2527999 RepID=A0A5C5WWG3_9BACT|nr:ATPase, T2SS/T4P/T4SS family [Rubripirellula amarantea]TWT54549.1 Type II secretion system protein E [Rubripirellula amarantea]